jgi:hypothetical protein
VFHSIHQSYNRIKLKTFRIFTKEHRDINLIVEQITMLYGVKEIFFRDSTGSLIIHYDSTKILSSKIINTLSAMGYLPGIKALPIPFVKANKPKLDFPMSDISKLLLSTFLIEASKHVSETLLSQTGRIIVKKILS